jgi:uncharacterized protein
MIMATEEVYKILSKGTDGCDEKIVSSLVQSNFLTELTPKKEAEYVMKAVESRYTPINEYTVFTLILTYECNMRCDYCFESHVFNREKAWLNQKMSFDQVDAAFDFMNNFDATTPVHLFGGEPLMRENYELVEYILKKGTLLKKSFVVVTNGLHADAFIPLLTKYKVGSLQISLDGLAEIHDKRKKSLDKKGSFSTIVSNIDALDTAGVPVFVRVVYDHSTVKTVPDLVHFIKKRWPSVMTYVTPVRHHCAGGCFNFLVDTQEKDFTFFAESDVIDEFWRGLHPLRQKLGVTEGWAPVPTYCRHQPAQLWFDPFGDLYFCTDSLGDKEHAVGTYYPDVTYNDQYDLWKKRTIFSMNSCRHCRYALICGGGCAHYAYHKKGSLTAPDCTFSRQAVTVYYPLIGKLFQMFKNQKQF